MKGRDQLWEKFHQGDRSSIDLLLDEYYRILQHSAKNHLRNEQEFRSIILEALHILWEQRLEINNKEHLQGKLFLIVRNKVIDLVRKPAYQLYLKTEPLTDEAHDVTDAWRDIGNPPGGINDLLEEIHTEIRHIRGKKLRKAGIMLLIEGKTTKEVSIILNLSESVVREMKSRVMKKLRKKFKNRRNNFDYNGLITILINLLG